MATTFDVNDPRSLAFFHAASASLDECDERLTGLLAQQFGLKQQLRQYERQLEQRRAELAPEIDGKNAEQRGFALTLALARDGIAANNTRLADECHVNIAALTVEIESFERRRAGVLASLNYASSWLRYHAAEGNGR